jgi:hypothetical protein
VLLYECRGARQTGLLTIGEKDDDVVCDRRACTQCSYRLEQDRDAGPIVRCRRTACHTIVVRSEQQRVSGRTLTRKPGDDIRHSANH